MQNPVYVQMRCSLRCSKLIAVGLMTTQEIMTGLRPVIYGREARPEVLDFLHTRLGLETRLRTSRNVVEREGKGYRRGAPNLMPQGRPQGHLRGIVTMDRYQPQVISHTPRDKQRTARKSLRLAEFHYAPRSLR